MSSLFTKILQGEIPCHKIAEDEGCFAFLDIRPLNPGHTLVIPKQEIDYFFELDDDLLSAMTLFAKRIALAIEKSVPCERVGVMVAGLEVPHAHMHLVPIRAVADLDFSRAKNASQEELAAIAEKIRSYL